MRWISTRSRRNSGQVCLGRLRGRYSAISRFGIIQIVWRTTCCEANLLVILAAARQDSGPESMCLWSGRMRSRSAGSFAEVLESRRLLAAQLVLDLQGGTDGSGAQPIATVGTLAYFWT